MQDKLDQNSRQAVLRPEKPFGSLGTGIVIAVDACFLFVLGLPLLDLAGVPPLDSDCGMGGARDTIRSLIVNCLPCTIVCAPAATILSWHIAGRWGKALGSIILSLMIVWAIRFVYGMLQL